jgi:hypothetical protein
VGYVLSEYAKTPNAGKFRFGKTEIKKLDREVMESIIRT